MCADMIVLRDRRPMAHRRVHDKILGAIGETPMVRINRITAGRVAADVLAKLETFNPGNSIKDRMALKMIEDAEHAGYLKPGGVIVEGTSGNTGMGLAIAAVVKGYRCVFTTTDKQSKEKVDALRAFGAEVIVCPTDVEPDDPRSYYSVASRLARETPGAWKAGQYDNLSNTAAHYEQTGPEIWRQTGGRVTQLVSGVGTGGTISGVGRFLKTQNAAIKVWGIDTYGSALKKYKDTGVLDKNEIYPYITEGIGEDFLPGNVDFAVIDASREGDRQGRGRDDAAHRARGGHLRRQLGRRGDGRLAAARAITSQRDDMVVVIFHDHGTRYLGKMFNDEWMRARFPRKEGTHGTRSRSNHERRLVTVDYTDTVARAVQVMTESGYSQMPVTRGGRVVGSVNEACLYAERCETTQPRAGRSAR